MMRRFAASVATSALLLGGCGMRLTQYRDYHGDGTFTPQAAAWICRDGYSVDLGDVDLTVAGELTRRLDGLPSMEAAVGLALAQKNATPHDGPDAGYVRHPVALIALSVRDEHGHIVLARHERLSDWTARVAPAEPDRAWLYRRGTQVDVPLAPGMLREERFPIGRDDSWGSSFVPRRGARYTLHFAVEEPDAGAAGIDARLQVNAAAGCP